MSAGHGNGGVRAAAIQMSSGADVASNLQTVDALLAEAASRNVSLAVLPENLAIMGANERDKIRAAEVPGTGPIQSFLADAASRHALWVVAGSLPLRSPDADRCFGASLVYDPDGNASEVYRKIHLFDVDVPDSDERYRESESMAGGNELVVVSTPLGQLGLSICYDLRFPELYRLLVEQGATVFSVPAAFAATTGRAHWRALLKARAIENLAYVIAAGQYGAHPGGRQTHGHSMIVDPWGRVIAEQETGDGVIDADIDVALVGRLREEFPVLAHRRL